MIQTMLVRWQTPEISAFVRKSVLKWTVAVFLDKKDYLAAANAMEKDIRWDLGSGTAKTAEVRWGISEAWNEWFAIAPDGFSPDEVSSSVEPMLKSNGY